MKRPFPVLQVKVRGWFDLRRQNQTLRADLHDAWQLIADLRADLEDVSADLRASQAINQELMAWCPSNLRELEP